MLASVAEQASLSLTWSETPKDTFSRDVAQLYKYCSLTDIPIHILFQATSFIKWASIATLAVGAIALISGSRKREGRRMEPM